MVDKSKVLKINGFSKGLNIHQIFSYITLLIQILLFSFFIVPNFTTSIRILFSVLYYTSTALVIVFGYKATVIDPTDEIVFLERRCRLEGKPFDETRYLYQCDFCQTSVHDNSKHCRTCDRCVNDFDHHCNWVNNCVSRKNYAAFFIATAGLTFSSCLFLIGGLLFVFDYYTNSLEILNNTTVSQGDPNENWKPIIMAIFSGITAVFFILVFKLIIFHTYLIKNKMSTYEYILKQRETKDKKKVTKRTQQSKLREKKISPILHDLKNAENERNETPKEKGESEESDSDSSESEDSIEVQTSDRPAIPQIQLSAQSSLSSQRESKTLMRRGTCQGREMQGADTERLEKLIRASSCRDIDLEENIAVASPENRLTRKRKSELPPVTIETLKLDQDTRKNLGLKEIFVSSPVNAETHLRNHQDTSTDGPLSFSSRTFSVTWSGQNQRLIRHFSNPKQEHYEYGNFIKTESNMTTPKQYDKKEVSGQRGKPKSIAEFEKVDLRPKRLASFGPTEYTPSKAEEL